MKSNNAIIIALVIGLAVLLLGFFLWKTFKQEMVTVKIDEIQDVRGLGYSGQRKVAINEDGEIFVAYRKKFQGKNEIFVSKIFREKATWKVLKSSKPISFVGGGVDQRVPSISIDSKNNLHLVWYGAQSDSDDQINNRQIKYSKSSDGGQNWTKWQNISPVDGYDGEDYWQEHPYLLIGAQGELFVVWEGKDKDNKSQQVKFAKSLDEGKTWSEWKNAWETSDKTQSRPTMVQEKSGRLLVFAYSSFENTINKQQIVHSWSDDKGESWSKWEVLSDSQFDSRHASAVIDSTGKTHVAWRAMESDGRSQIMHRFLQEGNWSQTQIVADSNAYQLFPSIGANSNGDIFITWMESENSSKLPNEDPADGKIYTMIFSEGKYSQPVLASKSTIGLYPNLPEISKAKIPPLLYEEEGNSNEEFSVMINLEK